jgi:hypothetical protein
MRFRDSWIDERVIQCLSRPQYEYSCSLTALTAVINYLYANNESQLQTQEHVARVLGLAPREVGIDGGPGNATVMEWFCQYLAAKGLVGDAAIAFDQNDLWPWDADENAKSVRRLKAIVQDPSLVMVYHRTNHYLLVCGYFESAEQPHRAFAEDPLVERWLVLADHSPDNPPIRAVRWRDVRRQLKKGRRYALIAFGNGRQVRDRIRRAGG